MKKQSITAAALFLIAASAYAADSESSVRFVLGGGGTMSSKTAFNVPGASAPIDGEMRQFGVEGYAGIEYRVNESISLVNTLGYHIRDIRFGGEQKARFTSVPFDGIVFYNFNESIRLGAGIEVSGRAKVAASAMTPELSFKTSPNALLQAEYLITPKIGLSMRYVFGNYKMENGAGKIKSDHAALLANFYF